MPHRKNAKGDIGNAKKFSDSYDMDNIYLTEEGWVYRHFKNTERTLWWDEILVAGQVIPDQEINGVTNGPGVESGTPGADQVIETNPLKLGTVAEVPFQVGDSVNDYRYSDHIDGEDPTQVVEKVVKPTDPKDTGFYQVAWDGINVDPAPTVPTSWGTDGLRYHDGATGLRDGYPNTSEFEDQVPEGWGGVSTPDNGSGVPEYDTSNVTPNEYTIPQEPTPEPPPEIIVGEFPSGAGGGRAGAVTEQ